MQFKTSSNVTIRKAFIAKAKAEREVKGDHTLQYVTHRDYVVELQSTNPNTIVKIVVERNIDPSLPTRVFKRIYVFLEALKLGFRAYRRELLGLDDAFMKGPFPSQVLAVVGLDLNNGIYPLAYALVEVEREDVDVVNAEGFDRDTCYDDETNTYMSRRLNELRKDMEEAVKTEIPVNAIQDQLQCDLELQVSVSKPFKVKAKAEREVKGDHTLQYVTLRDYVVELQSTNHNTTIRIVVERNIDHSLPTWVFKRIYVCLGALKLGFRACRRELLGLDDAFMKGPFSSQVLAGVGLDSNNGIYPLAYALVEAEKHRRCLRHIHENMKHRWCGQTYKDLLWRFASAKAVRDFKKCMLELKKMNLEAHKWYQVSGSFGNQCIVDVVARTRSCRKWKLIGIPCKYVVAACWNMAQNERDVPPTKAWVETMHKPVCSLLVGNLVVQVLVLEVEAHPMMKEMSDGIPTQLSAATGASEWAILRDFRHRQLIYEEVARKDATQIVANLQRQQVHSRLIACDYLEANIDLMDILASGYILESQHMKKFFDFIQLPNFDIAADAAATFKGIMDLYMDSVPLISISAERRLWNCIEFQVSIIHSKEAVVKTHSMTPINETSKLLQDNEVGEPKDDVVQKHSSQVRESKDDIVQKHSSQVRELKDDVVQNHGSHAKPDPSEMKKIAAKGILTCLQDVMDSLNKGEDQLSDMRN
ncbi:transposase, MuDR, MULE transposase domain protein [Tanacetum coccineum]